VNQFLTTELESKREDLESLCLEYGVARLDLFGSGVTEQWQPEESDLDFVVAFKPDRERSIADRYLGLAERLEELFHRSVDLITERAIRNPYFRDNVDATRTPVYAE